MCLLQATIFGNDKNCLLSNEFFRFKDAHLLNFDKIHLKHKSLLFYIQMERHLIMQTVCEATQATEVCLKIAALQCLVKIMSLYYQFMESYMGPALFAITLVAMKSDVDEVRKQYLHLITYY